MDDDNLPSDNLQQGNQGNQTILSKNLLDSKTDNKNNYHRFVCEQPFQERDDDDEMIKRHKAAYVLCTILFIFVGIDIFIEVHFKFYNYK